LKKAKEEIKTATVRNALKMGLPVEQAATLAEVSVDVVEQIRQKMTGEQ